MAREKESDGQFDEKEAQERFEAALQAPHKPLKEKPKKTAAAKRRATKKKK